MAGQVNALKNRLQIILPVKTREAHYRAFILRHFDHCSQIWHHCREINTTKLEREIQSALRVRVRLTSTTTTTTTEGLELKIAKCIGLLTCNIYQVKGVGEWI